VGFIILERIADFLSGNANCEFHPKKKHKPTPVIWGSLLMSLSFYVLLINIWAGILIVSILLSLLAKCSSSLSQFFCVKQGSKGHEGRYMALFTMSFSLAHAVLKRD
jgi:hypothetical protein